jgi:hypothetical protein
MSFDQVRSQNSWEYYRRSLWQVRHTSIGTLLLSDSIRQTCHVNYIMLINNSWTGGESNDVSPSVVNEGEVIGEKTNIYIDTD